MRVYLDANVLIGFTEKPERLADATIALWEAIEDGRVSGMTSWISWSEVAVFPLRDDMSDLLDLYRDIFDGIYLPIEVAGVSRDVVVRAARLRADHVGLKLPDALHVATALAFDCDAFVTSDRRLGVIPRLSILDPDSPADIPRFLAALP